MYIKLTRMNGRPIWLNASFVVTVEPTPIGGAIVVPIGDGLDYEVRESPETVLALLAGTPAPAVVPVTTTTVVPAPVTTTTVVPATTTTVVPAPAVVPPPPPPPVVVARPGYQTCPRCGGRGKEEHALGFKTKRCKLCGGKGFLPPPPPPEVHHHHHHRRY